MPFGAAPAGFLYFAGVKLLGYSSYAYAVNRTQPVASSELKPSSAWWVGGARTGIGLIVGAAVGLGYWGLASRLPGIEAHADTLFFTLLVPVRVLEWLLLLALFYRKFRFDTKRKVILIGCGIVVSFALDAIGMAAMFAIPGGLWVC